MSLTTLLSVFQKLTSRQKTFYTLTTVVFFIYIVLISGYYSGFEPQYGVDVFIGLVLFTPLSILLEILFLPLYSAVTDIADSNRYLQSRVDSEFKKYITMEYGNLMELVGETYEDETVNKFGKCFTYKTFIYWHDKNEGVIEVTSSISEKNSIDVFYSKNCIINSNGEMMDSGARL